LPTSFSPFVSFIRRRLHFVPVGEFFASVKSSTFLRAPIIVLVQRISSTKYVKTLFQLITQPSRTSVQYKSHSRTTGIFSSLAAKGAYSVEQLSVCARHENKDGQDITASD
jgi:hypothetical protein